MKPSKPLLTAVGAVIAFYGIRIVAKSVFEYMRYDKMRAMSNEPPMSTQLHKLAGETLAEERGTVTEWGDFLYKIPLELARYLKIESM